MLLAPQLNLRCCEHIRVEQTDELRAGFRAQQQLVIVLGQEKLLAMGTEEATAHTHDYTYWPMDLSRLPRNEGLKSMVRWRGACVCCASCCVFSLCL